MKRKFLSALLLTTIVFINGCGSSRIPEDMTSPAAETQSEQKEETGSDSAKVAETTEETKDKDKVQPEEQTQPEQGESEEVKEFIPTSPDASPAMLWEYDGYVDEAIEYYWRDDFLDTDYDGDGKTDRLLRSYTGDSDYCDYTIEFGNGKKLYVPHTVCTGFPHITGADTDMDGEKEILFTLTYDTSTDPFSFGNVYFYDLDSGVGEYREEELPLGRGNDDARTVMTDISRNDHTVTIKVPDLEFETDYELSDDALSSGWYDFAEPVTERTVCIAEIHNIDGKDTLFCYFEPLMKTGVLIGFELKYTDDGYVMSDPVFDAMPDYEM
ncbi:MAG: hypothetical protein IKR56_07095 [Lachnospiraceae bacterium]|nr:hypothetical protein [Lachnospiraceae bacterium]